MASYVVTFSIDIPVTGEDIKDEVDAMYEARNQFCNFNVNEFEKKVHSVDEKTVKEMIEIVNKMHNYDRR